MRMRSARIYPGVAFFALCVALSAVAARATCDSAIWGVVQNGDAYTFTPPAYAAVRAPNAPVFPFGTIARGIYSGYIYIVGGTGTSDALTAYNPTTNTQTKVGTFPNTTFLYASGFGPDGLGYVMSSSEAFSFTDAPTPVITRLGAPVTTSGPAITAFNSGDLAVDQSNTGWVILSNNSTGLSYLYQVVFGSGSTQLTRAAQITLNGTAYTTADLYSLAFGTSGTLYASSGSNGTLFSVNETTGALTSLGAQGQDLIDFASCPANVFTTVGKTGPSKTATGELVLYQVTATHSASSRAAAPQLTLSDPVPAGITIESESCTVTGGAVCGTPTVAGQTVSVAITALPPGSTATLNIHGMDASLAVGTTTNTASLASPFGVFAQASASTTVIANTLGKTVADITQGTTPGTTLTAVPGDVLEYVLTYTNYTGTPLSNLTIKDTVPANNTFVAASAVCVTVPAGATCTPAGPVSGLLTWTFTGTPIANGATLVVKFRATVN
jgi:uncharacterized repeat protein (TIGR01451 family)